MSYHDEKQQLPTTNGWIIIAIIKLDTDMWNVKCLQKAKLNSNFISSISISNIDYCLYLEMEVFRGRFAMIYLTSIYI